MFIPTDHLVAIATRKLIASLPPRSNSRATSQSSATSNQSGFDAGDEHHFWREHHDESIATLKAALLLGMLGFLAFVILDALGKNLSGIDITGRLLIVVILALLLIRLHHHPDPGGQIGPIARLAAGLAIIDLAITLVLDGRPRFYGEAWGGLLPVYFFCYGQLFMSIGESIVFGTGAMILLPLSGYLIGVDKVDLLASILILLIVNLFGFCTRCQLENHARRSFMARRRAECAAEDKTRFLHQLSHNLRQPLQAMSCYSAVLDSACNDQAITPIRPVADKLGNAIDELNAAFNRILDTTNLESGKQLPRLAAVDINQLLTTLENLFAPQAVRRKLKLKIRLCRKTPYCAYSDADILRQIIGNLIDNAIKYTAGGWVLVAAVKTGPRQLTLHVVDTGMGIDERQHEDIFKEFYRGHRRQQDNQVPGLGIGLAYVARAVTQLPEHRLELHSRPDTGSDFQLHLPLAAEPMESASASTARYEFAGSLVFIVDDDSQVLSALEKQLLGWGCLVQSATGKAEIEIALADTPRPPDLLICDYYLANGDTARDLVAHMTADCGPVPTLILSARAIPPAEKAQWPVDTLLLRKPVSAADLMATMAKAMRKTDSLY